MSVLEIREMGRKYNRTYAQVLLKGIEHPIGVYFDGFSDPDEEDPSCIINHILPIQYEEKELITGINLKVNSDRVSVKDITILPTLDTKVFDYGGRTLVYTRVPNRQWQKGIYPNNSSIVDIMRDYLYRIKENQSIKFEHTNERVFVLRCMHKLFQDDYAGSLEKALSDIDKFSLLSRTISDVYWVGLIPTEENSYLLFRHSSILAKYNNKSDTFTVVDKIYLQEVTDFCGRFNLKSNIEV
jgi:hypothetical protein